MRPILRILIWTLLLRRLWWRLRLSRLRHLYGKEAGRLLRRREMSVEVIHAFEEPTKHGCLAHLEHWFGRTHVADELDDDFERPIVCFCGARLEPLAYEHGEVSVAGVWHRSKYDWSSE